MRQLLATATSGDLSSDGATVDGPTVRDWLKRNLPKQAIDFAEQLMGQEAPPEPEWQLDALLDLLRERKVVPLDEAIRLAEAAANKIEALPSSILTASAFLAVINRLSVLPWRTRLPKRGLISCLLRPSPLPDSL
jgi:hypothetical protein